MLKRCTECGKPVYASAGSKRAECGYCYAKTAPGNLGPLTPSELDWRRPLYDAAVMMPPGEVARRRFAFLGDYGHAAQRIELCEREIARKDSIPEPASHPWEDLRTAAGEIAARIDPDQRKSASQPQSAMCAEQPAPDAGLPRVFETNPFNMLGATPRNTREELVMLQRDEALFGNGRAADEALAALIHPDSRLDAEIHWFPQTAPEEIGRLFSYLEASRQTGNLAAPVPHMPSALAQFNAVRLVLSTAPIENSWDFRAHILSLATVADALLTEQVMDEINADREQAMAASLQRQSQVDARIDNLLGETLSYMFARMPSFPARNEMSSLQRHLSRSYRGRSSAYRNSYFLELASGLLADR